MTKKQWLWNIPGAFADGAVLFPMIAALCLQGGFSATRLLVSAGLAYVVSGLFFRVPMSVQPLKSIAIAALAIGATPTEIRLAGAFLGLTCLALTLCDVNAYARRVPRTLVQGLQAGLGVILARQGLKYGVSVPLVALVAAMIFVPRFFKLHLLGLIALGGLAWAIFLGPGAGASQLAVLPVSPDHFGRLAVIVSLVLPQLALTLGNSVLGTRDVTQSYFGARAARVTERRLLGFIGVGNLLTAAYSGLPFCHGSGGVTAHVRGGATHWISNLIIGATLLVFGVIESRGAALTLNYPLVLLGSLLVATGVFHLGLAKATWQTAAGKLELTLMAAVAGVTQNMLWVLGAGVLFELAAWVTRTRAVKSFEVTA